MYSVSELREQWKEKVLELGLDPKWTENPAFYSALDEADGLISQMNMWTSSTIQLSPYATVRKS